MPDAYLGTVREKMKIIEKESIEEVLPKKKSVYTQDNIKDLMEKLLTIYNKKLAVFFKSLEISQTNRGN